MCYENIPYLRVNSLLLLLFFVCLIFFFLIRKFHQDIGGLKTGLLGCYIHILPLNDIFVNLFLSLTLHHCARADDRKFR